MVDFLEYKSIFKKDGAIVDDVDTKNRIITGYLSNFGNKDHDGDIIVKGAFAKSIKERGPQGTNDIMFLNQHHWWQPHGFFSELTEDSKGLRFVSNPLIDTSFSNDAVKLYAAGIVKEHSIGFQIVKKDGEWGNRTLTEIKLYEGSNVTLGANPETPFTGFKTSMKEINDESKRLIKAIRNGDFTDETFIMLEYALKQLQQQAFELGKNSSPEPHESTPIFDPLAVIKEFNKNFV